MDAEPDSTTARAAAWQALAAQARAARGRRILDLFDDPDRARDFSVRADGLLLDYSKTSMDGPARAALLDLARAADVSARREAMFRGARINRSENRAVLHTALRAPREPALIVEGENITALVHETLDRMADFAAGVRAGRITTPAGRRFTDVINIGIGGSDLGPVMTTRALRPFHDGPCTHFVSNVDGAAFADVTEKLDPQTTLVIVASKTFTTLETMTNAASAWDWLAGAVRDPAGHFVALSSAEEKVAQWGIPPERTFGFEDWVGGRYSIWGPIGLSLMLAIGPDHFRRFLAGGHAMDCHFRRAEGTDNMPLMLALSGIWHRQVLGYPTRAVIPYEERLARLPAYLQQLEMESNGKRVTLDGGVLEHPSAPVVWGEPGTNGQHAFFQLLHQGTDVVPCEFMLGRTGFEPDLERHHRLLAANCLAQSEALMRGRTRDEARALLAEQGLAGAELEYQAAQREFPGNRPSTTLIYERLTPFVLGQIIALYEHRVFVEGVIVNINSFDQWGVELGKELAGRLVPLLEGQEDEAARQATDGSTRMLLAALRGEQG